MASADFRIIFEMEPIVKLICRNVNCKFNQMNDIRNRAIYCNLKNIGLDEEGRCMNQEAIEKVEDK